MAQAKDVAAMAKRNVSARQAPAVQREEQGPRGMLRKMIPEFEKAMPRGMEATQLARDAMTCLSNNRELENLRDGGVSFVGALMTCAQLGLRPGVGALGQAYIIPFKGKAQFILGYQGMIELANRSGEIASISARAVHQNDEFDISYGLDETLVHKPVLNGERGPVIGYYAVGKRTNGGYSFVYMNRQEMIEHKIKFALAQNGPWKNHFDAMALKTVIRKLFTFLPRSTEIQSAIIADGTQRIDVSPDADLSQVVEYAETIDEEGNVIDDSEPPQEAPRAAAPRQAQQEPAPSDAGPYAQAGPDGEFVDPWTVGK